MKSLRSHPFLATLFAVSTISCGLIAAPQLSTKTLNELGLTRGEPIFIDLEVTPRLQIIGQIEIQGTKHTLQLRPHSVRSDEFVIRVQHDDGKFTDEITDPKTVRGFLVDDSGSQIFGSVLDNGLFAKIVMGDGTEHFIEPLAGRIEGAELGQHVLYSNSDVAPHDGSCGFENNLANVDENFEFADLFPPQPVKGAGGSLSVAELALDADFEYFQTYGTVQATSDRMEMIINIVNGQYESEVQITHMITAIIVRSSPADPYTSNDAGTLLNQFSNEWLNSQGGINRDVAHLFTGKNINGGTIGIAYIGAVCDITIHYGLSESDFNNNLACATDLTAHELGHNWNAGHCNCPNNTMNPGITCTNTFSNATINTIIAFANSLNCLDTTGAAPPNDDWVNTILIGSFPFTVNGTNINATTESGEQELANLGATVWWYFTAPGDGTVTVDTFGSDYDTWVHIYDGFFAGATVADLNPIANNDDANPGTLQSEIAFPVTAGACYEIRVSGFQGGGPPSMGNITLNGSFTEDMPVLVGDVNCDGAVNLLDVEPFIALVSSGTFDEKADINGDGMVNLLDVEPFIALVSG